MKESGLTTTSAIRQSNSRLTAAINHLVASSARCGLTSRSCKNANCFRGKRFSAARARRECVARTARLTRSTATEEIVRKRCQRARKLNDANAKDPTLRNDAGTRFRTGHSFCGRQGATEVQVNLSHFHELRIRPAHPYPPSAVRWICQAVGSVFRTPRKFSRSAAHSAQITQSCL